MKIAVIGANGQLGCDVVHAFVQNGDDVRGFTHGDIEIANPDSVRKALADLKPELIVNTAAMHHVENCEIEPEKAYAVNALGARNLAFAASECGAVLAHVSTDYVFGGNMTRPYNETDVPQPLNVYGNTKLGGEYFVRSITKRHFVLRTSALYGKAPCRAKNGQNFVDLMLKIANERGEVRVVDSECVTPTSTRELARQMVLLSRTECYGLYHATAEGSCSWYTFAHEIFEITNTRVSLSIAGPDEFPAKVPRPKYSVLENHALKLHGLNKFRPWQDALREYLGVSQLEREGSEREALLMGKQ